MLFNDDSYNIHIGESLHEHFSYEKTSNLITGAPATSGFLVGSLAQPEPSSQLTTIASALEGP